MFLFQRQVASGELVPPLVSQIASDDYAARVSLEKLEISRLLPDNTLFALLKDARYAELDAQIARLFTEAVIRVIEEGVDAQQALDEAQAQAEALYTESEP
jgi:hypothetical protein